VSLAWRPPNVTVARVRAIEISLTWRWVPVLILGTWLLAQNVLPASFPGWAVGTTWLTSATVVLAGEVALLLHELSHAVAAHGPDQGVTRIVFHGFRAETIVGAGMAEPAQEALIALAGPAMNLVLAGLAASVRFGFATHGPLDLLLLSLVIGNAAMAAMSLLPLSGSDGARALRAVERARSRARLEVEVAGQRQDEHNDDQQP